MHHLQALNLFESNVDSEGSKTQKFNNPTPKEFESNVDSEGSKTVVVVSA